MSYNIHQEDIKDIENCDFTKEEIKDQRYNSIINYK